MPELPEVESLALFLREHAKGRVVARADAASFAVLKTFDPPLSALTGRSITEVALESGFTHAQHFSTTFRRITGQTPSEYRQSLRQ